VTTTVVVMPLKAK